MKRNFYLKFITRFLSNNLSLHKFEKSTLKILKRILRYHPLFEASSGVGRITGS